MAPNLIRPAVVVLVLCGGSVCPSGLAAQSPPPVERTVAPEGSTNAFYRGVQLVASAAVSAAEHVYRALFGRDDGDDVLKGLREGRTVSLTYSAPAIREESAGRIDHEPAAPTEGVVTNVDRGRKRLRIRFERGSTETLEVVDHPPSAAPILVSYLDGEGRKISLSCRKVS